MKRFFVFILVVLLALPCFNGLSEAAKIPTSETFDYTQFEGQTGYIYNKIEKTWRFYSEYVQLWSDATFDWWFVIEGNKEKIDNAPWMGIMFLQEEEYKTITKLDVLIDEKLFTFEIFDKADDYVTMHLGKIGLEMIQSLQSAKTITFQVTYGYYSNTFDANMADMISIKGWANKLIAADAFAYCDKATIALIDAYYAATVE